MCNTEVVDAGYRLLSLAGSQETSKLTTSQAQLVDDLILVTEFVLTKIRIDDNIDVEFEEEWLDSITIESKVDWHYVVDTDDKKVEILYENVWVEIPILKGMTRGQIRNLLRSYRIPEKEIK